MHIKDLKKGTPKDHTGLTSPENDVTVGTGELKHSCYPESGKGSWDCALLYRR